MPHVIDTFELERKESQTRLASEYRIPFDFLLIFGSGVADVVGAMPFARCRRCCRIRYRSMATLGLGTGTSLIAHIFHPPNDVPNCI